MLEGEGVAVGLVHVVHEPPVVEVGAVALGVIEANMSLLLSARAHTARGHDWVSG